MLKTFFQPGASHYVTIISTLLIPSHIFILKNYVLFLKIKSCFPTKHLVPSKQYLFVKVISRSLQKTLFPKDISFPQENTFSKEKPCSLNLSFSVLITPCPHQIVSHSLKKISFFLSQEPKLGLKLDVVLNK